MLGEQQGHRSGIVVLGGEGEVIRGEMRRIDGREDGNDVGTDGERGRTGDG